MDALLQAMFLAAKRRVASNECLSLYMMESESTTAASPAAQAAAPARKVFKVAVDDSTVILGLKKNTRDGIKKWVNQGAIQLFIPLHSKHPLAHPTLWDGLTL